MAGLDFYIQKRIVLVALEDGIMLDKYYEGNHTNYGYRNRILEVSTVQHSISLLAAACCTLSLLLHLHYHAVLVKLTQLPRKLYTL